jgi:hypothetical protein
MHLNYKWIYKKLGSISFLIDLCFSMFAIVVIPVNSHHFRKTIVPDPRRQSNDDRTRWIVFKASRW